MVKNKPKVIKQRDSTTRNHFKQWCYLNSLKKGEFAVCSCGDSPDIAGRTGTYHTPSILTLSEFGFDIPKSARVDKIILRYQDTLTEQGGAWGKIGKPKILFNPIGNSRTAGAVGKTYKTHAITINKAYKSGWTPAKVNNLSLQIKYPKNSSTNPTRLYLRKLTVEVLYTTPKYKLSITDIPQELRPNQEFDLTFNVSNTNKVKHNPSIHINLPEGLDYLKQTSGTGEITKLNEDVLKWNPKISDTVLNSSITLRFKAKTKGIHELTVQTAVRSYSSPVTISLEALQRIKVTEFSPPELKIKDTEQAVFSLLAEADEPFSNDERVIIHIKGQADTEPGKVIFKEITGTSEQDITSSIPRVETTDQETGEFIAQYEWTPDVSSSLSKRLQVSVYPDDYIGDFNIKNYYLEDLISNYTVEFYPADIGTVNYTGIILDTDETEVMSRGIRYLAKANLRINDPKNHYLDGVYDVGVNHRIGVFNKDMDIFFNDRTGHSTERWVNDGFNQSIINSNNDCTILQPKRIDAFYVIDFKLDRTENYSIKFNYLHYHYPEDNPNPFDMNDKKIGIGNSKYTFEALGITDTCVVELNIKNQILSVIINEGTEKQIGLIPDLPANYYVWFQAGESKSETYDESLTFKNFQIKKLGQTHSPDEIMEYAYNHMNEEDWSDVLTKSNEWEAMDASFSYDDTAPVVVLLTGEPSHYYPNDVNLQFTQPVVYEDLALDEDNENFFNEEDPNFLKPVDFILTGESATVSGDSNEMVFSNFEELLMGQTEKLAFTGLSLVFDCDGEKEVTVLASISVNSEEGNRSAVINFEDEDESKKDDVYDSDDKYPEEDYTHHVNIGGRFDRWGLDFEDFQEIETLEVSLGIHGKDVEDEVGSITINNFKVIVYYNEIDDYPYSVFVDGMDTRNYGMFIRDIKIPMGINTENKYLTVEGTDVNEPYNMSVRSKQITIDFDIEGYSSSPEVEDGLIDAAEQLKQLSKLFANERSEFNKPILKTISFSHLPGEYFEFLMKQSVDNQAVIDTFVGSIVLEIPSGASYSEDVISTGAYGANQGLISVKPVITINHLTSHNIKITEQNSKKHMIIRDDDLVIDLKFTKDDYIKINCEDRTCMLYKWVSNKEEADADEGRYEEHDIDTCVDFLSNWFTLGGEYAFECDGATVHRVEFRERG